ncbi:hypothetical protein DFH29DRAFT_876851 [Suillus ampliporus]|nr:hypothetical protein DFH29DRAFT_876851 [Suillus ampliporus]
MGWMVRVAGGADGSPARVRVGGLAIVVTLSHHPLTLILYASKEQFQLSFGRVFNTQVASNKYAQSQKTSISNSCSRVYCVYNAKDDSPPIVHIAAKAALQVVGKYYALMDDNEVYLIAIGRVAVKIELTKIGETASGQPTAQ